MDLNIRFRVVPPEERSPSHEYQLFCILQDAE
jgi:hypothetical protein